MPVTATVTESISFRSIAQPRGVQVTPADVDRGYVVVPAATRLEVANARCVLEFRITQPFVRAATVTTPFGATRFGSREIAQQITRAGQRNAIDVSYRLELTRDVTPGIYPWPVMLTVNPF